MKRPLVQRAVISLVAGAALTVVSAVSIALWAPPPDWPSGDALDIPSVQARLRDHVPFESSNDTASLLSWAGAVGRSEWNLMGTTRTTQDADVPIQWWVTERAFGFPFIAIYQVSVAHSTPQGPTLIECCMTGPIGSLELIGARAKRIPLCASPVGFACNTVVYALAWFGLVAGLGAYRRGRRRRRGLCRSCGYPVGTAEKCTECGSAV